MYSFRFQHALLFAGVFFTALGCGETSSMPPGAAPGTAPEPPTPGSDHMDPALLYADSAILDFKLTFTDAEWAKFEELHNNPPPDDMRDTYAKIYVHCGFEALGMKFPDAACRPKGNPQYWKDERKPQFVVSFNHWLDKARFFTLRKLNLESNPFAVAPINDCIGMGVMSQAGIKAPRCNHVQVFKNGTLLGLYMNVEVVDKEFLQSRFPNAEGNLYSQGLILETNTTVPDTSRLMALNSKIESEPLDGDHTLFFAEIEQMVDIHEVLAETAAEVVLPPGDNWSNGGTNFYYYDNPASGKFVVVPWDLDTIMSARYAPADASPYDFWGAAELTFPPNKLLELLYQQQIWKKEFDDNLVNVRDMIYSKLPPRIDQVCGQIRDAFIADQNHAATVESFDADCAAHKTHVTNRIAYLQTVLGR